MYQLDSELIALRLRLGALEEQKRIEAEYASDKKAFPMKNLEGIIDGKRKQIATTRYTLASGTTFNAELHKNRDIETVEFLESIVNMLKNIQGRLEVLENKS
jgi:hypothetical protein